MRGLPRPERVVQLCNADLQVEFPPLRATYDLLNYVFLCS